MTKIGDNRPAQTGQLGKTTSSQVKTSWSGGFGKLNINQLGPSSTPKDVTRGQVGLPPPEGETDSEAASEGAQLIRSLVLPGEGGKPTFDFTPGGVQSFATAASEQFADLDGYNVTTNLGSIGEVSPERREELRRLSLDWERYSSNLNDGQKQELNAGLAAKLNEAIDSTFANNNIDIKPSEMERFFKFDPAVPQDENFLAKLGGYISAMRGESPDGAFGPRCAQLLEKFINLTGDLSTSLAAPQGAAFGKLQTTVGGKAGGSGGGVPPAGGNGGPFF